MAAHDNLHTEEAEILEMMRKLEAGEPLTGFEQSLLAMFRANGIGFKGDPTPLNARIRKVYYRTPKGDT